MLACYASGFFRFVVEGRRRGEGEGGGVGVGARAGGHG